MTCNPIIPEVLHGCARCGDDHERLEFRELAHPIELDHEPALTHWALCPTTGEPILLTVAAEAA